MERGVARYPAVVLCIMMNHDCDVNKQELKVIFNWQIIAITSICIYLSVNLLCVIIISVLIVVRPNYRPPGCDFTILQLKSRFRDDDDDYGVLSRTREGDEYCRRL